MYVQGLVYPGSRNEPEDKPYIDKKFFWLLMTALQVADVGITMFVLALSPTNHELNPIPLDILFPIKILIFPTVYTLLVFSKPAMKLFKGESNRNLGIYLAVLFCSAVLLNNLIEWVVSI